jgi:hypothetical protein
MRYVQNIWCGAVRFTFRLCYYLAAVAARDSASPALFSFWTTSEVDSNLSCNEPNQLTDLSIERSNGSRVAFFLSCIVVDRSWGGQRIFPNRRTT